MILDPNYYKSLNQKRTGCREGNRYVGDFDHPSTYASIGGQVQIRFRSPAA